MSNMNNKLTIGMATYRDYDGAYFSIQAIRLYHREVLKRLEFIIIDNDPDGPCSKPLKDLGNHIENFQYFPNTEIRGTSVRDLIFRQAATPYVLCMDSHVMLYPGSLKKLLDYFDAHQECRDLFQGPLLRDDLKSFSTHFDPVWRAGMYGVWETDERGADPEAPPFEIPMQGLGVFACRKDAWPGFNPRFSGFGGEEGYIHRKFKNAGAGTLCLPFLRWLHRFGRPDGQAYTLLWNDRIRNYLIGFSEVNMDTLPVTQHFRELLGLGNYEKIRFPIMKEMQNPFFYFDAIYCINLNSATDRWQTMKHRFERMGIFHRVRRFAAIESPESHHIGCALSHRAIIEKAQNQNLENVLIFEGDARILEGILKHLEKSVEELKKKPWKIFHLGGHRWGKDFPKAEGSDFLLYPVNKLTSAQAVAYSKRAYQEILDEIPSHIEGMKKWLSTYRGFDKYLRFVDQRYLSFPSVTSQAPLLPQEDAENRDKLF